MQSFITFHKQHPLIMFLSTLITHMFIHVMKPFLKAKVHCSKYHIFGGQIYFQSYGQWVKAIGAEISYSVEDLGMMMFSSTTKSRAKRW